MARIVRTVSEIEDLQADAIRAGHGDDNWLVSPKYRSYSYEQGVAEALSWLLGESGHPLRD
jgi:hypothetical protein